MHREIKRTKIGLNTVIDFAKGEAGNMRQFEIAGTGTFLLTEFHPQLTSQFAIGTEVETYATEEELFEKIGRCALKMSIAKHLKSVVIQGSKTLDNVALHGIEYLLESRKANKRHQNEVVVFKNEKTMVIVTELDVSCKKVQPPDHSYYIGIAFQEEGKFIDINENGGVIHFPCVMNTGFRYEGRYTSFDDCMLHKLRRGFAAMHTSFSTYWIRRQFEVGGGGFPKVVAMPILLLNEKIRDYLNLERSDFGWVVKSKTSASPKKRKRMQEDIINTKNIKLCC
jgi:hypothetical protein